MDRLRGIAGIFLALLLVLLYVRESGAATNADAFMSLPFGHSLTRTQKRMEKSGAVMTAVKEEYLSMEGYFEGKPAVFVFGFDRKKGLKSKAVYIQSSGSSDTDRNFYNILLQAYTAQYGKVRETPQPNTWREGRIMLNSVWTPDRYTTITLMFNPEATRRFPGSGLGQRPIHLIYTYSKWDK